MSSRGNRKIQLIILLVLVSLVGTMSIAYAVLSTTLNINGTAQVQDASWNVHFSNIQVNPYSVPINPTITDNNKITFSANLTKPGDFYKFTVDIVNEGSIDAMIESIIKTPELTAEQKKYLRYEIEYIDGTSINDSQLLKTGETKTISFLFSYRNDIPTSDLPTTETEFDLEIVLVYVQANNSGIEISGNEKIVKVVSGDLNTVGSEICINTECFYLISNDGDKVTMLAKYNLYAGGIRNNVESWTKYGEEATGIQNSLMKGWTNNSYPYYGTHPFYENPYWSYDKYPVYVYNSNSLLYPFIENYKTYLIDFGIEIINARLISMEELIKLGCSTSNTNCSVSQYNWTYSSSYWTGTAYDSTNTWRVVSNGGFGYNHNYGNIYDHGIRPVIEIPLTEF